MTSQKLLAYFREGTFKSADSTKLASLGAATTSRLDFIEMNPVGYKHLFKALFLSDNLGYLSLSPFKVEDKHALLVLDHETSRAWLLITIFSRIRAQMRRQNLYILDKMKALKFAHDQLTHASDDGIS